MPRQPQQELSGAIRINPTASPVDTFAVTDAKALAAPVSKELINFSEFSNILGRVVQERNASLNEELAKVARIAGERVESGEKLDKVLADLTESGTTPRGVASRLAAAVKAGKIQESANPVFLKNYEQGRGRTVALKFSRTLEVLEEQAVGAIMADPESRINSEEAALKIFQDHAMTADPETGQTIYDGLGYWGKQQLNSDLILAGEEFLDRVTSRLNEARKAEAQSDFGIAVSTSTEQLIAASRLGSKEGVTTAIKSIGQLIGDFKLSGDPEADKKIRNTILNMGDVLADGFGHEEAAEALREIVDRAAYGTSTYFDNNLDGAAAILQKAEQLEAEGRRLSREQEADRALKNIENTSRYDMEHGVSFAQTYRQGRGALKQLIDEMHTTILNDESLTDEEKVFMMENWLTSKEATWGRKADARETSNAKVIDRILAFGRFGATGQAQDNLNSALRDGDITPEDAAVVQIELDRRNSTSWVHQNNTFNRSQEPSPQSPIWQALERTGMFTEFDSVDQRAVLDEQSLAYESNRIFQVVEARVRDWANQEKIRNLPEEERQYELGEFIRGQIAQEIEPIAKKFKEENQVKAKAQQEKAQAEAKTLTSGPIRAADINPESVTTLGGLVAINDLKPLQEIERQVTGAVFGRSGNILEKLESTVRSSVPGTQKPDPYPASMLAKFRAVDKLPIDSDDKDRVKTDMLARMGGLSLNELINEDFTPDRFKGAQKPDRIKALSNTKIDISGIEIGSLFLPELKDPRAWLDQGENGTLILSEYARSKQTAKLMQVGLLLQELGFEPTEENVVVFLHRQANHHIARGLDND